MGMNLDAKGSSKGAQPEMNVTPLVDVVLVLLIIFMIITPQLDNKVPVDLPQLLHADPEAKGKMDPVEITITSEGAYFVEKEAFETIDVLQEMLQEVHAQEPTRRVVIRADKSSKFVAARDVFKMVKETGYKGASLVVSKPGGSEEDGA